jgi:cell division septation protein DedD
VKFLIAVGLALLAAQVSAATAYVSDELVLGVYTEQNGQGQRLATLHSGASVETLSVNGEFTQVRLSDGTSGWVKSAYLTTQEPATVRLKQLEEELDRSRATTPALAEAAARSEMQHLKGELADKQSELDAARAALAVAQGTAAPGTSTAAAGTSTPGTSTPSTSTPSTSTPGTAAPGSSPPGADLSDVVLGASAADSAASRDTAVGALSKAAATLLSPMRPWVWPAAVVIALGLGFWLGYATLARRVRHKFGGIKVY